MRLQPIVLHSAGMRTWPRQLRKMPIAFESGMLKRIAGRKRTKDEEWHKWTQRAMRTARQIFLSEADSRWLRKNKLPFTDMQEWWSRQVLKTGSPSILFSLWSHTKVLKTRKYPGNWDDLRSVEGLHGLAACQARSLLDLGRSMVPRAWRCLDETSWKT